MKTLFNWYNAQVMLPLVNKNDLVALKQFAITISLGLMVVFMLLLPWWLDAYIPVWPLYVGIFFMVLYLFTPSTLYYPYVLWMIVASLLGFINTRMILALAYYLLIVPTGMFMQWRKKLQYQSSSKAKSMWVKRERPATKNNLKEPF